MRVTRWLGNPRKGQDRRPLHLKIRVVPTKRMKLGTLRKLVERAITTGIVPPGIEIRWIDWRKGQEGRANEGRIPDPQLDELRVWYSAMALADVKYARVDRGNE